MKLTNYEWWRTGRLGTLCWIVMGLAGMTLAQMTHAQGVSTTTVQGTVYLANGQAGAGTLVVSWPAFTTAAGQAIAADSLTYTIPADGFVSVNLTPNVGALPAGLYYTAVYYMSDGTVSTQYWQVPAAASASLAQIQVQVMPAAQAVQAVSKAYVDEAIAQISGSGLSATGGTLTAPLYLNADPTQPLQAATKHYVDTQVATDVPLAGGNMTGALGTPAVNGVEAPAAGSAQTTLQAALTAAGTNGAMQIPPTYAGTDTFTNPNGVKVTDLRTGVAQQTERSVKEFGAVCDGATDDTNALQAALNYADTHNVALTIPEGTCKTRTLNWHGESIGGLGKQVSALMGFPGQDVLATTADSTNLLQYTRLHDLTIYVDQSVDVSCTAAKGRAAAGSCQVSRPMEANSIFSPGGNGLTSTAGTGAAWSVGNCAIAMLAATGAGGNGLRVAEIENLEIATTGADPMAQYTGAHSTHTCGLYLAQWPQWSEFRNIDIRGLNTGVAIPALPVATPAGLTADSNRWQNVTIQATHAFTAAAGSNNVLDNVVAMTGNSSATGEPPTGLVLDLAGTQQGWTMRNAVVLPTWTAVQPALTVTSAGGAVTAVALGTEHGLGWDPYGTSVPLAFSGSCSAQGTATVNSNGSISAVSVTAGGVGCSSTTTASVNAAGTWDTDASVNLIGGQDMTFFAGNLLKGNGGYTVWNAANSVSYGTQLDGGGGTLPGGGSYPALVANSQLGSTYLVDQFPGVDIGAKLQACLSAVNTSYGGTCDARNFTGNLSMASNLTISTGNTTVLLPCATISTANQIIVTAGTRNVTLRGCALRGGSAASGSQGGTALAYSGASAMVQVGDPTYAVDTPGFHLDNVVINTTAATSANAKGLTAYRTQEMDLESLYLLGNGNQTGITLDGTGNYTGGTFLDDQIDGFQTALNAIGHQVANPATTDWMNASAFVRVHIDCPTSGGSPVSGTIGINLQQGDGNTFTGGDVEGCSTALHLGPNAQNNTFVGLRNENSTSQVAADAGSSYNNWMTGGTMFTGQLTDNGTRNSFLDTFHRSFNGMNGDWYGSQQDATVTNHFRLGIGAGNERGLENRYQTDFGYRWTMGLSDATGGEQYYQILDELNNVYRFQIGQYNNGQSSTNNQTVINAAGTGAIVLNGSNNAGTGGVVFGSGGASESTVATVSNAGNAQFNGTLQVGGTSQSTGTMTVRNNADAEVDYYLWPGLTTSQKGSFTYKDWNGNSQWYLVKDASNNWEVNSAIGGLDSFKAYQSTNSGDTYVDASNSTGHIRLNYETGSGVETDIYSGGSSSLDASFLGPTSIKFPGLAAGTGHYCLQVDTSGYMTNTGVACGTGSGSGTVGSGSANAIAYYTASGTTVAGESTVPVASGGTGAASASAALTNLGGVAATGGTMTGALTAPQFSGPLTGNVTGNVTGNATTATALATTPTQCSGNNYATGVTASGTANCTQVSYSQIGGTTPTWNQNTTGTASNVTETVAMANGGTGAITAAGAIANLLPGVSTYSSNGIGVAGNAQLNGTLQVGGTSTFTGSTTVMNQANAEIDSILQAGSSASQKESFLYRDWNGSNQWYLLKDASNNWALNSAVGGLDSFKAYQSTNSGDTYVDASNSTGHIRLNYETGSGSETDIYSGSSSSLDAAFLGPTSIKFPGLAAGSGFYCLQVDSSGYITNTGTACGSGGGGTTGTVNSATTGQIAYYTTNGTVIGGQNTVPLTAGGTGAATAAAAVSNLLPGVASNGSDGVIVSGNVSAATATAKMIGGAEYASQYQTGSGNNGIANASSGATGQTVIADPSYGTTELPTTTSFSANSLHYQDLRKGSTVDYYHNPALYLWNWPYYGWLGQTGDTKACLFDGIQYTGAVTGIGCQNLEFASTAPGWSIGNPPVTGGGSGWLSGGDLAIVDHSNSAGIFQAVGINHFKYGIGDNVGVYSTINNSHNGWIAASDEGTKAIAGKVLEDPNTYTGTITSGASTGSTSIKTTVVTDGGSQGVGQYLIDTTQSPVTGTYTAIGNGVLGGSSVTVNVTGGTVTASQAWGTLTANAAAPLNTTPPFSTSETITVSVTSGTFSSSTSVPYCFAGTFHEIAFATSVSTTSGVATIAIPLRRPHASGTYVFQGGMCGYGFEETAFDQTPNSQTLRYLFDVVGSESPTNLQVIQYEPNGAVGAPLHAFTYQTVNLASGVSNGGSGTTVSFTNAGGGTLSSPSQYVGSAFTFSGLSDSALNAACTGVVWTSSSTGTCTIAGLSGSHTSTTTGTASLALNQFALRPMAEILDVQNETLSPPQVDGTLALEPNVIPFSNGDTIESPHHATALMQGQTLAKVDYNPYQFGGLLGSTWQGAGANGGSNIPGSTAILNVANQTADSTYPENGGVLQAPNYFSMLGSYYNGLIADHAPGKNAAFLDINPTSTQILDASYCSSVWAESSYSSLQVCPNAGTAQLNASGMQTYNATSHKFFGIVNGVNGFQVNSNIVLPATLTGYHGNASGIKVPLATNWTNTSGALLCDDGNGNLTITACTVNATQVNGAAAPTSKTIVGTNASGQIIDASSITLANNTTGTAANITATSNSTLTTLSALSLPIGQVTGTINATQVNGAAAPTSKTIVGTNASGQIIDASSITLANNTTGTAANITATSNSTLTTLSALSLPIGQVSGTINATQVNGAAAPTSKTIVGTNASGQIIDASSMTLANNTTGTAANITATSNSTLITLSALSVPISQVTGAINATLVNGAVVPASAAVLASGSSGQATAATPHQLMLPTLCADTSSSSTTYTCTTTPSLASLTKGDTFRFTSINQINSSSATLNIDGIGAVTIRKWQNTANLASGDLQANAAVSLTYDGTYLELDTIGNAPTAAIPSQYKTWSVQDGVVGTAALPTSGFPAVGIGYNSTGVTETITAIRCYVDGGTATTVTFTDGSGNNLLSGTSLTCSSSWASGSLSTTTTTIASSGFIKWTPTPDGTAKEITVVISGTY